MLSRILTILLLGLSLTTSSPIWAAKVNINKANAAALQENLTGIGPVKAQAIIDYRRKHGAFKRLDDLTSVPGIGETTLRNIRRDLSLGSGVTKGSGKSLSKPAASSSTRSRRPKAFDKVEKPRGKSGMKDKSARKAKGDTDTKAKKKTKADKSTGDKKSKKKSADKKKSAKKKKARKDKKGDKKKAKKSKKDKDKKK